MLNGRNFTQLVTLSPGVVNQTGQDEGAVGVNGSVAYSMNGGRTEYNILTLRQEVPLWADTDRPPRRKL